MIDNHPVGAPAAGQSVPKRPAHLRLLMGGLGLLWRGGALPRPDLRAETLRQQAEAATGLSDDSLDRGFFDSQLTVLLAALHGEAQLNDFGRLLAHGLILKVMKERLWFEALLRRHPEIATITLAPPVVIVGQMRSGTTRLQRLLACNGRFDALKLYESQSPVPSPRTLQAIRAGRADPRIRQTAWGLRFLASLNPAILHAHPTGAEMVDEEVGLLLQSLSGALIEGQWRVPSFARHGEAVRQAPAYARLKLLLQLRCWLGGHDPARPLVLKSPQYLQDLEVVRQLFPDALFLFLHRDPATMLASGASLIRQQMMIQSDSVDAEWIRREWAHKTAFRDAVARRVRPRIAADRQLDIDYDEMSGDWQTAIRRIQAQCGLPPDAHALQRMAAWLALSVRTHGYDRHVYG